MTERKIYQTMTSLSQDLHNFDYSGAQNYLIFLQDLWKIIPIGQRGIRKPPANKKKEVHSLQEKAKKDFKKILEIFSKYNLNDEKFASARKTLTKKNNMNLQSMVSNLDSVYSIAKNNKFEFRLYKGKEEMEFFIQGIRNFNLSQIEVIDGIEEKSIKIAS